MISTNQIAYFKRSAVFFEGDKSHLVMFSCYFGHVVYSDQKVKASEILSDT